MKRLGSAVALCIAALWSPLLSAALLAEVDRSEVQLGESLTLTLRATDKEDFSNLKLAPLQRNFSIHSSKRNSSYTVANGRTEYVSELELVLSPRRHGAIQIPALHLEGSLSKPITVKVSEANDSPQAQDTVFVEVEVDSDSVYVQAQLIYSFRVYRSVQVDELRLSPLEVPGVVVESLGDNSFQRQLNGKNYLVTELKYALFPQKSGTLTIPSLSFSGRERTTRLSMATVRLRTQELSVTVKPIPASYPDAAWLPSKQLDIDEIWSVAPDSLSLGESVTRTITLTAQGISGTQLPSLELEATAGIKVYQDQPKAQSLTDERGTKGLAVSSAALLVVAAGDYQLPAVRIPWWDTENNQLRYAELPARDLSISPAVLTPNDTIGNQFNDAGVNITSGTIPTPLPGNSIWFWATLACLCGWALTSILLWRRRAPIALTEEIHSVVSVSEKQLFGNLERAASGQDNSELRSALLAWGQVWFDTSEHLSLADISSQIDDEVVAEELARMEQSLFSGTASEWQGSRLVKLLNGWRSQQRDHRKSSRPPPLPSLYG